MEKKNAYSPNNGGWLKQGDKKDEIGQGRCSSANSITSPVEENISLLPCLSLSFLLKSWRYFLHSCWSFDNNVVIFKFMQLLFFYSSYFISLIVTDCYDFIFVIFKRANIFKCILRLMISNLIYGVEGPTIVFT